MCQLRECCSVRVRNLPVTLILHTTRVRSQLLGRVSGVAASQTTCDKQTNDTFGKGPGQYSLGIGGFKITRCENARTIHYTCIYVCICLNIYMHKWTYLCVCIHECMHRYMYMPVNIYMYIYKKQSPWKSTKGNAMISTRQCLAKIVTVSDIGGRMAQWLTKIIEYYTF